MVAGLIGLALIAGSAPVTAHGNPNHGTIKVHDEEAVDPEERNQPHVCGEFWIQGFTMSDDSGHLEFTALPPTGDGETVVLTADWDADSGSEADGWGFNAGPFTLDVGHYSVTAYVDEPEEHPNDHWSKKKNFWVECEEGNPEPPPEERPACPTQLLAVANQDGSVTLTWDLSVSANVSGYNVYRSENGDDFDLLAQVGADATTYTDATTTVGVTYTYTVTAFTDSLESEACEEVEVTAIPDFPTLLGFGLAAAGGVLAYAMRRKA